MSALKFTLTPAAKKVVDKSPALRLSAAQLKADMRAVNAAYDRVQAVAGEFSEVDTCLTYTQRALENLSKFGLTDQMMAVYNADKALESLTGLDAKLITKEIALEGLGQAAIDGFKSFLEMIKKAILAVRDFIGKVFNTVGNKQREIAKNLDNIDMQKEISICKPAELIEIFTNMLEVNAAVVSFIPQIKKIIAEDVKGFDVAPYRERVKMICDKFGGILTFDETSGTIELKPLGQMFSKQSLSAAGWSKGDLKKLSEVFIVPKCISGIADAQWAVTEALVKRSTEFSAGMVDDIDNGPANFVKGCRTVLTWTQTIMRCIIAVQRAGYFAVSQVYSCIKSGEAGAEAPQA